jgi:hypothetical protein
MKIFSLLDSKLESYGQPFFFQHPGQAVRFLQDLVRDGKNQVSQHPEDFRLFQLGAYDPTVGRFENLPVPIFLADAISFVESPNGR